jgi:aminopeptidase N
MLRHLFPAAALSLFAAIAHAQGGSFGAQNPFSAPNAKVQYAPDRNYDLQNLILDLKVDYPSRTLNAVATNTIVALRDGEVHLRFHAGRNTKIESVTIDGRDDHFVRDAEGIIADCPPTKTGAKSVVAISYHLKKSEGGGGGWHWHEPKANDPSKVGLWTNGEFADTRDWAVTWDYPNDFATTETRTTVPNDWQVIGNGLPISDKPNPDGKTHVVTWRMTQPHATYLTSIVAGPFDIKKDVWRGMPVYYVCPKGMGAKMDYTMEHTKDMLSFYSDKLGVKYPWPKYAEDFTYDFGGGQENVSATTFGLFFTTPRDDNHASDWILAHEMGHQWFGDYVTCKDWGQLWLNESFATFMEMSYIRFSRGASAAQREEESNSQGYFQESRRYRRPLATNFYSNPGVMFDQHTYPKGGELLTTLRKKLGDKLFYAGLNRYLTNHHGSPVETNMLCNEMTEATGINLHPWFDQWILKPGHPVIDWSWSWDDVKKEVVVHVKQTQDTSNGTPIYDVETHILAIPFHEALHPQAIHLNAAEQEFRINTNGGKPLSVVFDPDHEFLREIPKYPWADSELPVIAMRDPNAVERQYAFTHMLAGTPSDETVRIAVDILRQDTDFEPAIVDSSALGNLKRPELTSFWESELKHANFTRRVAAVNALAALPSDPAITAVLRRLINDKEAFRVVAAATRAVGKADFAGSLALIQHQAQTSENAEVRGAALTLLVKNNAPGAVNLMFDSLRGSTSDEAQSAGMEALAEYKGEDPRIVSSVRSALASSDFNTIFRALAVANKRKSKELVPDLEAVKKRYPFLGEQVDSAIKSMQR